MRRRRAWEKESLGEGEGLQGEVLPKQEQQPPLQKLEQTVG
jgi:hypothetical protein